MRERVHTEANLDFFFVGDRSLFPMFPPMCLCVCVCVCVCVVLLGGGVQETFARRRRAGEPIGVVVCWQLKIETFLTVPSATLSDSSCLELELPQAM